MTKSSPKHDFAAELSALGYQRFSYLKRMMRRNPAEVLLGALNEPDLDARVAEGLPWLVMTYVDMDWDWLVRNAKVRDGQNRLGFTVSLVGDVAGGKNDMERARELRQYLEVLEGTRLACEDTFCHNSMTQSSCVPTTLRSARPRALLGQPRTVAGERSRPSSLALRLRSSSGLGCSRMLGC